MEQLHVPDAFASPSSSSGSNLSSRPLAQLPEVFKSHAATSLPPPPRRKRFSLNVSAPTSPISPPTTAFPFDESSRLSTGPSTARPSPTRPSSSYGIPAGPHYAARNSFYRVPSDDHRNASLDSLIDSSSIKLLLIGDAAVGKTAMILSYANELPTRSQLSLVSTAAPRKRPSQRNKLQNLKTIEKRKRYSLNDYEELFNKPSYAPPPLLEETAQMDYLHPEYDPNEIVIDTRSTIGVDIKTNLVNIDNRYFKIIMWDTAGQERYRNAMIPSLYKGSNGVLLSYDICNKVSFESCCNHWLREVLDNCPNLNKVRFYLVGNKIDLYKVRQVTHEDVLRFIDMIEQRFGISVAGNFEVSCKWHQVVERTFNIIIKDLVEHGCYESDETSGISQPLAEPEQSQICQDFESIDEGEQTETHTNNSALVRRHNHNKSDTIDITKPQDSDGGNTNSSCCV